jgi:hypothetical protein
MFSASIPEFPAATFTLRSAASEPAGVANFTKLAEPLHHDRKTTRRAHE